MHPTSGTSTDSSRGRSSMTQRVSDALGVFSPAQGLMSSPSTEWNEQTVGLLRGRLKGLSVVVLLGSMAFSVRGLVVDSPLPWWAPLGVLVAVVALASLLHGPLELGLWPLRTLEVATFWGLTVVFLWIDWTLARAALQQANSDAAVGHWNLAALHVVLLIAAYALFIPNSWQRGALIVVPMALAPVAMEAAFEMRYPTLRQAAALDPTLGLQQQSTAWLLLAAAVCMAIYGTHVINRYRVAAAEANRMGQYELRRRIGRGGMGEVWLASHRLLARPAAIKLVRAERLTGHAGSEPPERVLQRFEREARATAELTSAHTVELYDFGISDDGVFYYVMEYLDGVDLDRLVEEHGPLPAGRVVFLLLQACASLADAHAHGLVHRDIKPANLIICRKGTEHDFLKVLDFGLVKRTTPRGADLRRLTQEGVAAGTPAFMAPELAVGDGNIDGRTDVYSLGCVAYWLLTGQLVFSRDNPVAMVVDHVKAEPEAPSRRTELGIPEELDGIVLRCLAKSPDERYQSVDELAEALERVNLAEPWGRMRAAEWWRLHRPAEETAGEAG